MSLNRRRRDESGAFAVAYAILAILLISIAALGTDLGNGISRKTSVQSQADFAAYDAGQKLTSSVRVGMTIPATVVDQVRDTLNANQPQTDNSACETTTPVTCVTSPMLTDGNLSNGEVRVTSLGLQVVAPWANVDFGLANAMGINGTNVVADATVNVFSPGRGVFPMFAISGCDSGRQTLTDPANGHAEGSPNLALSSNPIGNGPAKLSSLKVIDGAGAEVDTVPPTATGHLVRITSGAWSSTKSIGFFKPDGSTYYEILPPGLLNAGTATPATTPVTGNTTVLDVAIPAAVAADEGVWYVRAKAGNQDRWTPNDADIKSFRVGQSLLECGAGSQGGNFGTLRIPRDDTTPSNQIGYNIAKGLQAPKINLAIHNHTAAGWTGFCTNGVDGARESTGPNDMKLDTNCVQTDPGLPANVATAGFVTGIHTGQSNVNGLLNAPSLCDRNGGTAQRAVTIQGTTYQLNNDVLSCFLKDGKSLGDIAAPTYNGPAALTSDVLKSPRFGYVPVLAIQPNNGTSNRYSIIDFRPAFITDEVPGAGATKGSTTGTADNGLTFAGNDLVSIKVVFFDIDALPRDGSIPVIDYLGVGKPIVHLVD